MRLVSDWRECFTSTRDLLAGPEPIFLNRVGGSDTNAVACLLETGHEHALKDGSPVMAHLPTVQRYNGYYDTAAETSNYLRYLAELLSLYKASKSLFFCNHQLLSMYFPDNINARFFQADFPGKVGFRMLVEAIEAAGQIDTCFPYTFVEKMVSHPLALFPVFAEVLRGKRVLVVSPFSQSITSNFANRSRFFKNYSYPDFELVTCNTPITYAGLPASFYPHGNWFETTDALKHQVSELEFDIALLACGSYAMPIGHHIAQTLGRKAVYVGGILQLYFGVMGRRYAENVFFMDQINPDAFILPLESQAFVGHVTVTPATAKEAFGAYF